MGIILAHGPRMLAWPLHATLALVLVAAEPAPRGSRVVDAPPQLAAVSSDGAIVVSHDGGRSWSPVHRCVAGSANLDQESDVDIEVAELDAETSCEPGELPAALAWHRRVLHLACAGGPLMRWDPDTGVQAVQTAAGAGVTALGAGEGLLISDTAGNIWSYDGPGAAPDGPAELLGRAPEPPIAIAQMGRGTRATVVLAGPSAVWRLNRGSSTWTPIITARACALASASAVPLDDSGDEDHGDRVWLAGPSGLIELGVESLETWHTSALTGVTRWGESMLVADGHDLYVVARGGNASRAATQERALAAGGALVSEQALLPALGRVSLWRAIWSHWEIGARITYTRGREHRDVALWIWISCNLPLEDL